MTGVSIGVCSNSTGISIIANGISNYQAINSYGTCYFTSRQGEGTLMNGLSFGRVTITSGGDLGSGSLGWAHEGNTFVPNMVISKATSTI